jgi:hypothetical protein
LVTGDRPGPVSVRVPYRDNTAWLQSDKLTEGLIDAMWPP